MKNLFIYNPSRNKGEDKSEEPVTYLSYKITERKEDVWLGILGCISDHFLPDFVDIFKEQYPDFWTDKPVKDPFTAYYETEIGKIGMALNFGLKDSTSNIVKLQNILIQAKGPSDVLGEHSQNYDFRKRYQSVKAKYDFLLDKARKCVQGDLVFFEYGGDLSISSDIANNLSYRFPGKYIVVAYKKGNVSNISIRGKNVRKILENVLKEVSGSGGGHEDAVGARISLEDLGKFREVFEKEMRK